VNNRLSRSDGGVGCLTAFRLFVCEWAVLDGGCVLRDETVDLGGIVVSIPLFAVVVVVCKSFAPIWTRIGLICTAEVHIELRSI
jgi:hypothetical protein